MASVYYNATLEYDTNTVEFWRFGDNGEAVDFPAIVTFNIQRVDDENNNYSVAGIVSGNHVTFSVTPPMSLFSSGDTVYDYDNPSYDHIFSVKSSNEVYIAGKLNLIKVA